jgi:dual specificity MAP kinase phosphatase
MPLPSTLTLAREMLNDLKDGQMPSEMIHFDMYATGVPTERPEFDAFYSRLLHLLSFMQDQVSRKRNILIHCSDGYTESSLLGLSWIMYHLKLSLPDAYLYLQKKRSFFVYAADVLALRRIEHALFHDNVEPEPKRRKSMTESIQKLTVGRPSLDSDEDEDDMVDVQPLKTSHHRVLHNDAYINTVSNFSNDTTQILPSTNAYQQLQLSPTKEEERLYPWFYSSRFEGSFPSRILPFLYLGNLNHATNPEMLKALNITHIVSVGENANLSNQEFQLLSLDNLYDDGIDTIRSRLDQVMEFVGM